MATHSEAAAEVDSAFAEDVRTGLGREPKRLSCRFLYDAEGSRLFEAICQLPDYYVTAAEREILEHRAHQIVGRLAPDTSLIELGSGSAAKTCHLIEAFVATHGRARYLPVDISRDVLEECGTRLARTWPTVEVHPIAAEYGPGLAIANASERGRRKLLIWLGSSIGNYPPSEARVFLQSLRGMLAADDLFLIGIDLRKQRRLLERAYDDDHGVTARFNLNLLARINRELGGQFELARFAHRVICDDASGCVSMYLVSRGAQRVRIGALDLTVELADGEAIHTESSYKYHPEEIDALASDAGFSVDESWCDRLGHFSLNLFAPTRH